MERVQYIAKKRARFTVMGAPVNIPWGTPVDMVDGFLQRDGAILCATTSKNAHEYFARNDDGNGQERGALTTAILDRLAKRDKDHQNRWNLVWEDRVCQQYRRQEHADFWLWNHAFYEAPVEDLRHIARLIGARGVRV